MAVPPQLHGLLLINKPAGLSSFDVLRQLKWVLGRNTKMGHAGTLDPFATGLLIVCLGKATKLVPMLMDVSKGYSVTARFGQLTDTLDKMGVVLGEQVVPDAFEDLVRKAIRLLGGQYKQIPPVFSALKHEGAPLYHLAREQLLDEGVLQELAESKARWVIIYKLIVDSIDRPRLSFSCEVSKGAYIRSLADDLAQKIDLRATTEELCRTFIGPFLISDAVELESLRNRQCVEKVLMNVEKARTLLA